MVEWIKNEEKSEKIENIQFFLIIGMLGRKDGRSLDEKIILSIAWSN